jgi:hypothetical protein
MEIDQANKSKQIPLKYRAIENKKIEKVVINKGAGVLNLIVSLHLLKKFFYNR